MAVPVASLLPTTHAMPESAIWGGYSPAVACQRLPRPCSLGDPADAPLDPGLSPASALPTLVPSPDLSRANSCVNLAFSCRSSFAAAFASSMSRCPRQSSLCRAFTVQAAFGESTLLGLGLGLVAVKHAARGGGGDGKQIVLAYARGWRSLH